MTGLLLTRFATIGGVFPPLTYVGEVNFVDATSPDTEQTFTAVNLGPVYPGRRIVLVAHAAVVNGNGDGYMTGITLDGVSMTQRATNTPTGVNNFHTTVYDISDDTNTDADIVVTLLDAGTDLAIVLHVYSLNSPKTTVVDGADFTSPFNFTRTFAVDDIYVGGGRCLSTATEDWTNATEDNAVALSGRTRWSCASYVSDAAGSRTITFTPSNTGSALLISAVYT